MRGLSISERYATLIVAIIGAIAVIISAYIGSISGSTISFRNSPDQISIQEQEISSLKSQMESINQKLTKVDSDLATLAKSSDQNKNSLLVARIQTSLSEVQTKVSSLEQIIIEDPDKAISLPLMRNEMDGMKTLYDTRLDALEQSLDRSLSQVYTILGTVTVVIGVGFLGVAWTNLRSTSRPDNES